MLAGPCRFQVGNARGESGRQDEGTRSGELNRDVEWQDLIGVPGRSQLFEARDLGQRDVVQVIDGVGDSQTVRRTNQRAVEDRGLVELILAIRAELRPDVVDVGQEAALGFSKQVQKRMAIEVDPDQ